MKKFTTLLAYLALTLVGFSQVYYGNPRLSVILSTNIPAVGYVLASDGTLNYWTAAGVSTNDPVYLYSLTNATEVVMTNVWGWDRIDDHQIRLFVDTNSFASAATDWALYKALTNVNVDHFAVTNVSTNGINFEDGTWFRPTDWVYLTNSPAYSITVGDTNNWTVALGYTNYAWLAWSWGDWATNYLNWGMITNTPLTLAGYGITDAYTKVESDGKYATTGTVDGVISSNATADACWDSATLQSGGDLSSAGNTTTVSACVVRIRKSNNVTSEFEIVSFAETNLIPNVVGTMYKVLVASDGVTLSAGNANGYSVITLGRVMVDQFGIAHEEMSGHRLNDGVHKGHKRTADLRGFEPSKDVIVSQPSVLTSSFNIASGAIWRGSVELSFPGFTNGSDFFYVYKTNGTYTYVITNRIDVANYNDSTQDDGLTAIGFGRAKADRIFVHDTDGDVYVVMGQESEKEADILANGYPSDIPDIVDDFGTYIAKIIIDKDAVEFNRILMVEKTGIGGTTITKHNGLTELQGGSEALSQYYHFILSEYSWLTNLITSSEMDYLTLTNGTEYTTAGARPFWVSDAAGRLWPTAHKMEVASRTISGVMGTNLQTVLQGLGTYIPAGVEIIVKIADGTHTMQSGILIPPFNGGGTFKITADTVVSNAVHRNQAATLDFSGVAGDAIFGINIQSDVFIENIKIISKGTNGYAPIYFSTSRGVYLSYCNCTSTNGTSGYGIRIDKAGCQIRSCVIDNQDRAVFITSRSHVLSISNAGTNNSSRAFEVQGSILSLFSDSTIEGLTNVAVGGLIINTTGAILP